MRKIIDRFILGRLFWPSLILVWSVYALAEPRLVTLDVDGQDVAVYLDALPEPGVVREGEAARTVMLWTAEDARRIQVALDGQGLSYALPEVLAALRPADRAPLCLLVELPDGSVERVTVAGAPGRTADGRIVWTPGQLSALVSAVQGRGWAELVPELIGLRDGAVPTAAPQPSEPTPLNPACGECLNGGLCRVAGREACCTTGTGCMACKVCIKVQGVDGGQ